MKYELNDKPGLFPMLMYGLQWWIVSLPCVVIMGIIVSQLHYTDVSEQTFYLQKLFGIMGIAMIVQVLWGHRLPLIIGPASVLLIGILSTVSSGIAAVYTGIMIGGLVLTVLAYSGLLGKLQFVFTPRIVTVILILIAFTLTPVILKLVLGDTVHALFNLFFTLIMVLALVVGNKLLRGIWKSTTVLWGIVGGVLVYYLANGFPTLMSTGAGIMPEQATLFNFPLEFETGTILAFLFCYIALIVNELGSIQAVGHMLQADRMDRRTSRGVGIVGVTNVLSGMFGVIGPVDYSMSPGVISATGCASRYTLIPAGIGLILCAFFPSVVGILVTIPGVVMGAILLYLMATQLAAGLQMLVREKAITDFDNGVVVGLPLMVALLLSFAPEEVLNLIPSLFRPIVGNGFVMGVITVLIMEHLIFKKR
ncbi:uracil-xanthine permease family protein [Butyricimonas paravirosa]|uniref:uracil-xanthine permease family protein n=1 Tax=Butyricimonas paravirosa TaxID=1472417 RepID=UPI0021087D09|nr:solute carrier family 23 protein [Butyricimonas paravirosa]MCQ4874283.1 purine/pyrimidine permease [Butyricimonas paravirosa]